LVRISRKGPRRSVSLPDEDVGVFDEHAVPHAIGQARRSVPAGSDGLNGNVTEGLGHRAVRALGVAMQAV
jgi:hypothetical protein